MKDSIVLGSSVSMNPILLRNLSSFEIIWGFGLDYEGKKYFASYFRGSSTSKED